MTDNRQDLYKSYILEKTAVMREQLRVLNCGPLCSTIVPSPMGTGFRNRAKFKIFHKDRSLRIVGTDPIRGEAPVEETLWILPEWARACVLAVCEFIQDNYYESPIDGFEIQLTHGRKQCHISLSVRRGASDSYEELIGNLIENISALHGVAVPSKKKEFGEPFLNHRILDLDILAHYLAFFQSNIHLIPKLLQNVRSSLKKDSFRTIIDLYCGAGLFSIVLRDKAAEIKGVDSAQWAVKSAKLNGERLGLHHVNFLCLSVEEFLEGAALSKNDLLILNPPRQGVSPVVIETIASMRPRKICLVSCFLKTHLRDLKLWRDLGYSIRSLAAFDMFPFTDFLETVTVLES